MPSGLIATPRHESYTSGSGGGTPLSGPPARLADCGNVLFAQGVSLRLKINLKKEGTHLGLPSHDTRIKSQLSISSLKCIDIDGFELTYHIYRLISSASL